MPTERVILITCPSKKEAKKIGYHLVSEKLAACVNIIPGLISIFYWQGKLNEEKEVLLIIKTRSSCFSKLEKRIRQIHSYSVPEVIALPIIQGSRAYLQWIREMTLSKKPQSMKKR